MVIWEFPLFHVGSKTFYCRQNCDDLLYDPDEDDLNESWAEEVRRQSRGLASPSKKKLASNANQHNKVKPLPNSDAVLNCPACFTLLCLDCQRHTLYSNQYRAMFVQNCSVDSTQKLEFPMSKKDKKRSQKNRKGKSSKSSEGAATEDNSSLTAASASNQTEESNEELFNPVKCDTCSTEVGVYDKEEIYHFFNIIASH